MMTSLYRGIVLQQQQQQQQQHILLQREGKILDGKTAKQRISFFSANSYIMASDPVEELKKKKETIQVGHRRLMASVPDCDGNV